MVDGLFEHLPDDLKELVNILAAGKSVEFEHVMRESAKEEILSVDKAPLSEDERKHYKEFLATILAVPDTFLCHIYSGGFRDGFCACLRCLKMCDERNLDHLDDLLKSIQKELENKDPFDLMMEKLKYMKKVLG